MRGPLHGYRLTLAHEAHTVWAEVSPEFSPHEFRRPDRMAVEALRLFHRIRVRSGVPFRFVSDARLGGVGVSNSAHDELPCTAIDLRVHNSYERYRILKAAIEEGVVRIGIYQPTAGQEEQWGKNAGSVHLDASGALPQGVAWVQF